jgi:type III secretion protein W
VFAFIFHSLGADLKSGGSFIPPGQLHRLISVTRDLQAGLGAIKFFQGRMRIIQSLFQREGISLPPSVTFEQISKIFLTYLQERYPNAEKALQMSTKLGLTSDILAKIIVLSQMRDGVREVSIDRFFRSLEHRNEVFNSILDALEQLEDEYDELLEQGRDTEDSDEEIEPEEESLKELSKKLS